jgi:hypothetical protein
MDAEQIRAGFIKRNLNRARAQPDRLMAVRIAREFRQYFGWCAHLLTAEERRSIAAQLSILEHKLENRIWHEPAGPA